MALFNGFFCFNFPRSCALIRSKATSALLCVPNAENMRKWNARSVAAKPMIPCWVKCPRSNENCPRIRKPRLTTMRWAIVQNAFCSITSRGYEGMLQFSSRSNCRSRECSYQAWIFGQLQLSVISIYLFSGLSGIGHKCPSVFILGICEINRNFPHNFF